MDAGSSARSRGAAGWDRPDEQPDPRIGELLGARPSVRWRNFSWISPGPLLSAANDQIAKNLDDVVLERRAQWIAAQAASGVEDWAPDFVVDLESELRAERGRDDSVSFIVLGDPGEIDASQYAVVSPLEQVAGEGGGADFLFLLSDVLYPAGDVNTYPDGLFLPYRDLRMPLFAIPGNHDWYDGLAGFMFHFCGTEPPPPRLYGQVSLSSKQRLARRLWQLPNPPNRPELASWRDTRPRGWEPEGAVSDVIGARKPRQPAPYFALRLGPLTLVNIDTGIIGNIDYEQGEWLRRVSSLEGPKILLTGKPIYVDGEYHRGEIAWARPGATEERASVDDFVRDPANGYVAAIGGDVHNHQRYEVEVEAGRRIQYIVSGGGGAYLSATHRFGRIDLGDELPEGVAPVGESDFRCYPSRGDSLALFGRRLSHILRRVLPACAGAVALAVALFALFALTGVEIGEPVDRPAWQVLLAAALSPIVFAAIWVLATRLGRLAGPEATLAIPITAGVLSAFTFSALQNYLKSHKVFLEGPTWLWIVVIAAIFTATAPLLLVFLRFYGSRVFRLLRLAIVLATVALAAFLVLDYPVKTSAVIGFLLLTGLICQQSLALARRRLRVHYDAPSRRRRGEILRGVGQIGGGLVVTLVAATTGLALLPPESSIGGSLAIALISLVAVAAVFGTAELAYFWRAWLPRGAWRAVCRGDIDPDAAGEWLAATGFGPASPTER
ncbi:MAG: hypothetical protein ACR2OC_05730, partial [Solirubrobacterales bacterium]